MGNIRIESGDIVVRALDLAIPPGATPAQQAALNALVDYGKKIGVTVRIITVP